MKLKGKKIFRLVLLLLTLVITLGIVASCTGGVMPVGWSGSVASGSFIFVGNNAGRLVSINLTDNSVLRADPLQPQSTGGLLSCACGQGNTAVPIYGTPAVSDNAVFVAGYNGQLVSFRSDNFAKRWTYPQTGYKEAFVGGAVFYNEVVYIGCSDGFVYAVNAANGSEIAKYETGGKLWSTPAIDPDTETLYIGSYDKNLYALSLDNLTLKWSYTTEGSIISTPLIDNGTVYFGSFDRHLYALNASDGA